MENFNFYKRVELVCHAVPRGKVITYGQIALLCGKPKNARQAGTALNCKVSEGVPAHRVVNRMGYLSGAKAFGDNDYQRRLLEEEGVDVSDELRVDLNIYGWKHTIIDAIELSDLFKKVNI